MKKTIKSMVVLAAMALAFTSCGSTKVEDFRNKVPEAKSDEIDKVVVVDWTDRALGEVSAPTWLKNMRRGNSDTFKENWKVEPNRVVKISMATGKTEATAIFWKREKEQKINIVIPGSLQLNSYCDSFSYFLPYAFAISPIFCW